MLEKYGRAYLQEWHSPHNTQAKAPLEVCAFTNLQGFHHCEGPVRRSSIKGTNTQAKGTNTTYHVCLNDINLMEFFYMHSSNVSVCCISYQLSASQELIS